MVHYKDILIELLVYSLYLIAVVCLFWWLGSNHSALAGWLGLRDQVHLTMESVSSILGIAAAAMAIIISNRQTAYKELQVSRDQIYQQLELESINLFRFEIDNADLARIVWEDTMTYEDLTAGATEPGRPYQVLQHICQVLNLFEMAVRFKRNGTVHKDVFQSWEAWMFDLCRSEIFLHYWYLEGVRNNYIQLFREIIDEGLRGCHGDDRVAMIKKRREGEDDPAFDKFKNMIRRNLGT